MSNIKTNTTTGNEAGLIVNIPFNIKTTVDSIFSDFNKKDIQKIYFLVYKIAASGNYQVNARNHTWCLALETAELSTILDRLKTNMIIKGGGNHVEGKVSNSYQIINKYNTRDDNNHKIFYYQSQMDLPIWVQKYMIDGYTVKGKKFSNYIKAIPDPKLSITKESLLEENDALKAKIKALEEELAVTNAFIQQDYIQDMITSLSTSRSN